MTETLWMFVSCESERSLDSETSRGQRAREWLETFVALRVAPEFRGHSDALSRVRTG
jgi:hypothetical protein